MAESGSAVREIVVPGEPVSCDGRKAGFGMYRRQSGFFSSTLGIRTTRGGFVDILPLGGKYIPFRGDEVIGTVSEINASSWLLDINSPYPALLHASESPWKVDFNATGRYLTIGDNVIAEILSVDDSKHVQVTMRNQRLRKLNGGHVVDIPFGKVARVIGKNNSMIDMLRSVSGCRIIVGKNGRIWIDGEIERVLTVAKAIRMIDRESQTFGLTNRVREFLERNLDGR
ncbi:MAG: exosome complex protein Rrp4 [Thermoplasmata archaeon]|uniref:Exosome complex component Rrp4 n=1 Tax=Candidatus Sysuiplasma superficiale TaxID=2823368 RepID=A0A8J8CIB2_9ARCH|nr:RNA-binding protein [Candidatus Sysuiplasma superficiale]MBX8644798.1 exosome complex protein Rrp4 [Candidatus Sysuiplasma superficiale]